MSIRPIRKRFPFAGSARAPPATKTSPGNADRRRSPVDPYASTRLARRDRADDLRHRRGRRACSIISTCFELEARGESRKSLIRCTARALTYAKSSVASNNRSARQAVGAAATSARAVAVLLPRPDVGTPGALSNGELATLAGTSGLRYRVSADRPRAMASHGGRERGSATEARLVEKLRGRGASRLGVSGATSSSRGDGHPRRGGAARWVEIQLTDAMAGLIGVAVPCAAVDAVRLMGRQPASSSPTSRSHRPDVWPHGSRNSRGSDYAI